MRRDVSTLGYQNLSSQEDFEDEGQDEKCEIEVV